MRSKKQYHATKLRPIIQICARMIKDDPTLLDDIDAPGDERLLVLRKKMKTAIPELRDQSRCANCGASMAEYIRRVDVFNAGLVLRMSDIVINRLGQGIPFTEANMVRINAEPSIPHVVKNVTSIARTLGLIAKVKKDGKHVGAMWAITIRGWDALEGKEIPSQVTVFRNQIIERTDELTTFPRVFSEYRDHMKTRERDRRRIVHDQRPQIADYDPRRYAEIAGIHQGNLL